MALSQDVKHELTIRDDGVIHWLRKKRYFDNVELVAENNWRKVLEPGDSTVALPTKVAALCNFVWTPAVVSAYAAWKASQSVRPL